MSAGHPRSRKKLSDRAKRRWDKLHADSEKIEQIKKDVQASIFFDSSVNITPTSPTSLSGANNTIKPPSIRDAGALAQSRFEEHFEAVSRALLNRGYHY